MTVFTDKAQNGEHPTFCVIIDESHIAVTQNIGCSPLLSLQVVCQKVC